MKLHAEFRYATSMDNDIERDSFKAGSITIDLPSEPRLTNNAQVKETVEKAVVAALSEALHYRTLSYSVEKITRTK